MSTYEGNIHAHDHNHDHNHGPWPQIIGLIISVALTLIALWLVMQHLMSVRALNVTILVLAVAQIFVQLFFFMHITEGHGPKWHVWMLTLGFLLVITIVAGSIWIMSFGAEAY